MYDIDVCCVEKMRSKAEVAVKSDTTAPSSGPQTKNKQTPASSRDSINTASSEVTVRASD